MRFSKDTFSDLESGKIFSITDSVKFAKLIKDTGENRFAKLADTYEWQCSHRETRIALAPNAICLNKGIPCMFPPDIEVTQLT